MKVTTDSLPGKINAQQREFINPQPEIIDPESTPAWYAVRTKPNQEQLALRHYQNQNMTGYLPLMQVARRHARRIDQILRPVFPGYLFLHLPPQMRNWVAISATRGAIGPVSFGGTIPAVPDWVIHQLRAEENDLGLHDPARGQAALTPNCPVEVSLSCVALARGRFRSYRGQERIEVLLDILHRQIRTTVPADRVCRL